MGVLPPFFSDGNVIQCAVTIMVREHLRLLVCRLIYQALHQGCVGRHGLHQGVQTQESYEGLHVVRGLLI